MSPLWIYKASAGSGKTHALTMEYLRLVFLMPERYRNILAVTFTNKAAGEMKRRILTWLHDLSSGDPDDHRRERDHLAGLTGFSQDEITKRASGLLTSILNDYTAFSVGTIDKFFQSVIRAFTREIGIQPSYNLELDHSRVLTLAVDRLFQDIGKDASLADWLTRFAEERLEDSRSWNFRNDIQQLGMHLFREAFQELYSHTGMEVLEKQKLNAFQEELNEKHHVASSGIRKTGQDTLRSLELAGIAPDQFRGKSKSPAMLFAHAARDGQVNFTEARLKALDQEDKWLNKDAGEDFRGLTRSLLMPALNQVYQMQVLVNTVEAIKSNFYTLGILGDIQQRVQEYLKEHNLFLIADSSRFLKGILGAGQVPFVFEKTGARFKHIMLDEFQDTSVFQYENFRPLLEETLAAGSDNLVVGDVKQSIYRWRNSDWRILSSRLENDLGHQSLKNRTLEENYRSAGNIIRFNNTVFQLAPDLLATRIHHELEEVEADRDQITAEVTHFRNAYADAVQKMPAGRQREGGAVRMEFFPEEEGVGFKEQVLDRLPQWVRQMRDAGIRPGEIAILVRSRRDGIRVAQKLLEHQYRLISSESLLLSGNRSVSLLVAALRYLVEPGDEINNALLKYRSFQTGFLDVSHREDYFRAENHPSECLPEEFASRVGEFRQMPIFEGVEALIGVFGLGSLSADLPYIQAFQDLVLELQRRENMSIVNFLQYWDQHASLRGVQVSEDSDAIRILTIHRAKGLEFKGVIVPFCDWEVTTDHRKANMLWCETKGTPFSRIPTLPLRYTSKMKQTLFSSFYYRERMQGYLDSLNLLYVAFTRATDVLFAGIPDRKDGAWGRVGDLLSAIESRDAPISPSLGSLGKFREGRQLVIGEMPEFEDRSSGEEAWMFRSYVSRRGEDLPKLRLRSQEEWTAEEGISRSGRGFGNMMHLAFSRIRTARDVDAVVAGLKREGILEEAEAPGLLEEIRKMIRRPGVRDWFHPLPGDSLFTERALISGDGHLLRPDRVMVREGRCTVVDFKFGLQEKAADERQMVRYLSLLSKIYALPPQGFLWYAMLDRIKKVML